jgi:hypothetical protein
MKKILLFLLSSLCVHANLIPLDELDLDSTTIHIPQTRIYKSNNVKTKFKLFYNKDGFFVSDEYGIHQIKPYEIDKIFHGKRVNQIIRYLLNGKFYLSRYQEGEYKISSHGSLNGGGIGGATAGFYIGKALTHVVGHGAIQLVAICTGPGYFVTVTALEGILAVPIETASNVVGLGTGILGGTASGPV